MKIKIRFLLINAIFLLEIWCLNSLITSINLKKVLPTYNHNSNIHNNIKDNKTCNKINTNYKESNTDFLNSAINRQKKIDEERQDKVKVIINNDSDDFTGNDFLNYSYKITYSDFHNGIKKQTVQNVDGSEKYGRRVGNCYNNIYSLGVDDAGADHNSFGGYIPINDLFDIKIQINESYQPNTKVTLDSRHKQEIIYQSLILSNNYNLLNYSIEAVGILTAPRIYLIQNWKNVQTGNMESIKIGEYGVYNFFNKNGSWAIPVSGLCLGTVLSGISILGFLGLSKIARIWTEFYGVDNVSCFTRFIGNIGSPTRIYNKFNTYRESIIKSRQYNDITDNFDGVAYSITRSKEIVFLKSEMLSNSPESVPIYIPSI